MPKKDAYKVKIKDWPLSKLKKAALELDAYISDGCYGVSDMINLELMYRELERRGYEIEEVSPRHKLKITKTLL